MSGPDIYAALAPVVRVFNTLGTSYHIVGSVANSALGELAGALGIFENGADLLGERVLRTIQQIGMFHPMPSNKREWRFVDLECCICISSYHNDLHCI